jgi:hypothetical protein
MTDEVDAALERLTLPLDSEDRAFLKVAYPVVQSWLEQLRLADARYAEPAITFRAADRSAGAR